MEYDINCNTPGRNLYSENDTVNRVVGVTVGITMLAGIYTIAKFTTKKIAEQANAREMRKEMKKVVDILDED